jgi:transcriptional antiterminator Rof (Rho-off)
VIDALDQAERASFYRLALFLGLLPGEFVVGWADRVLARTGQPVAAFVEIATIPASDLTALRLALLGLCGERESAGVVKAVLGLIGRHLVTGRRSLTDTITVLMQMRGSVRLSADLADDLRRFEVDFFRASRTGDMAALERDLQLWLACYEGAESPFLDESAA